VARWIDALPREAVLADARLCLARGWAALYLDLDECDRRRRAAEAAPLPAPLHDGNASVEEGAAILEAARANLSGDVGAAIAAARRALAEIGDAASPSRAIANVHLGMAAYYAGDLATAEAAFAGVLRRPAGEAWASVLVTALGNLAAVRLDAGDLAAAEQTAAETERVIGELGVHEAPFTCRARARAREAARAARRRCRGAHGVRAGGRSGAPRRFAPRRRARPARARGTRPAARRTRQRARTCPRGTARALRVPRSRRTRRPAGTDRPLAAARAAGGAGGRRRRAERARADDPAPARERALAARDRLGALHLAEHGQGPHAQHLPQARRVDPRRRRHSRPRARGRRALRPGELRVRLRVAKNATELVYTGAVSGALNKPSVLSAVLKDAGGKPLAGRTVAFQLGTQSAKCGDRRERARDDLAEAHGREGHLQVTATFAPNAADGPYYDRSSQSAIFKLGVK
jgi:hypothetical protein